jgi:hypothetical protein
MTAAYLESMVETWKAEGLPDYEISARMKELILAQVRKDLRQITTMPRVYDPGISREEQDELIDEFCDLQRRLIKKLRVLIRRSRMHTIK